MVHSLNSIVYVPAGVAKQSCLNRKDEISQAFTTNCTSSLFDETYAKPYSNASMAKAKNIVGEIIFRTKDLSKLSMKRNRDFISVYSIKKVARL